MCSTEIRAYNFLRVAVDVVVSQYISATSGQHFFEHIAHSIKDAHCNVCQVLYLLHASFYIFLHGSFILVRVLITLAGTPTTIE